MAGRSRGAGEPKKETFIEMVLMFGLALAVLFGLVWFIASAKIVYWTAGMLRGVAIPWMLIDGDVWAKINEAYAFYKARPMDVTLFNYFSYASDCWRPWGFVLAFWVISVAVKRVIAPVTGGDSLRRTLEPMALMKELAKVYPAIVPVMHLGPDLMADKLPLWRRQTFPEEVWQKEMIDGKPMFDRVVDTAVTGEQVVEVKLNTARAEEYFRGDRKAGKYLMVRGRRWSRMLGFLAVDLIEDSKRSDEICFADRFSPQGKVIYALIAAYAFGGKEGKADYEKAAAALNRSCAGQTNGLPNLKVAQWIYDKYRNNAEARKLFAIHHWEYTYLYAMFIIAKLNGKITHTNFIWLKPLDRIMFYVLNTVGRQTPHTEGSSVFSQYDYEVQCARLRRLPLRLNEEGRYEAHLMMKTSVEGLQLEFDRYQLGHDDEDDWWKKSSSGIWSAARELRVQERASMAALKQVPLPPSNAFDDAAEAERKARNASDLADIANNAS